MIDVVGVPLTTCICDAVAYTKAACTVQRKRTLAGKIVVSVFCYEGRTGAMELSRESMT